METIDHSGDRAPNRDKPWIAVGDLVRATIGDRTITGIVVQRDITNAAILMHPETQEQPGFITAGNYAVTWLYFSQLDLA